MAEKALILKVCNDRVYFNPRLSIPIGKTNIPKAHLTFQSRADIFWTAEILNNDPEDTCLKVNVTDYSTSDIAAFENQQLVHDVNQLLFEKFDWKKLEPLLTYYHKINLGEFLTNLETAPFSRGEFPGMPSARKSNINFPQPILSHTTPETRTVTEDLWVYFSEARFMAGYVTFKKTVKKLAKELDFIIPNEHIRPEFENVKFWFAKKLKTKKFKVTVRIMLTGSDITETSATSTHIDQITPELIDSVKYQRTLDLIKEPKITGPDKLLFTAEDIFTQHDSEDIEGNVFNQSENDLLNFFLENRNIRNKKQLAYLSGKKQTENHKLHYTLHPNFGFLFFVEGATANHFVWELLHSHATYVWSIEKQHGAPFKRIETTINTVKAYGREPYKLAYRNDLLDSDLVFTAINHEDIASDDGFPKWKDKVNSLLG